jgi:hypothetical protein
MALSYFGNQTYNGGSVSSGVALALKSYVTYTCPGSGSMQIKELSSYCKKNSATVHNRVAIYNGNTLVAQGSAEVTLITSAGWQGHVAGDGSDITPSPATLTGGATYKLTVSYDADCQIYYGDDVTGRNRYTFTDYTGGFPATFADPADDAGSEYAIRCGVEAAAIGGLSIPIAMAYYRYRRI